MDKIKAVIFDMDGLMFATEKLWQKSVEVINQTHPEFYVPIDLIKACAGLRDDKTDKKIMEYFNGNFNLKEFRRLSDKIQDDDIAQNGIEIKTGLFELLTFLKQNNIKMAIASSSQLPDIKSNLKSAKLDESLFDYIIAGNMVTEPKPHPQMYSTAQQQLNIPHNNLIVLEDSDVGAMSAYNAGIKVIVVPDTRKPSQDVESIAFKIVPNLTYVIDIIKQINGIE